MSERRFIYELFTKLFKTLGLIKEHKISKREMCEKTIQADNCPNSCEICAWNEFR